MSEKNKPADPPEAAAKGAARSDAGRQVDVLRDVARRYDETMRILAK